MLDKVFFDDDACLLARKLLGKIIFHKADGLWRKARIIETEAYYENEKASHASLGYTHKRRALFMEGGTIYMYHSRAGASFNISAKGPGNAVLVKSAVAHLDNSFSVLEAMAADNPIKNRRTGETRPRPYEYLCSGQTLLCSSLRLKIDEWDAKSFDEKLFYIDDAGYAPEKIIVTSRLGIPFGRDEEKLPYRFIDESLAAFATKGEAKVYG